MFAIKLQARGYHMKKPILSTLLLLALLFPPSKASADFHSAEVMMLNQNEKTVLGPGEYLVFTSSAGVYRVTIKKDENFINKYDKWLLIVQPASVEEEESEEADELDFSAKRPLSM